MEQAPAFMTNEAAAQQQGGGGLLSQADQMQRGGGQQMPQGQDPMMGEDGEQASPEEQDQYEKMITNAMSTLHGEQSDLILEKLAQDGDPEQAVGDVVVSLIVKLYESAEEAGQPLSDAVILNGGEEILNEVVNLGMIAGVWGDIDEDEGETIQQEAMLIVMDKFGRYLEQQGRFNPEELDQGVQSANSGAFDSKINPSEGE